VEKFSSVGLALQVHIRLGCKGMTETNTLSYFRIENVVSRGKPLNPSLIVESKDEAIRL
jgi:hypothetical protein